MLEELMRLVLEFIPIEFRFLLRAVNTDWFRAVTSMPMQISEVRAIDVATNPSTQSQNQTRLMNVAMRYDTLLIDLYKYNRRTHEKLRNRKLYDRVVSIERWTGDMFDLDKMIRLESIHAVEENARIFYKYTSYTKRSLFTRKDRTIRYMLLRNGMQTLQLHQLNNTDAKLLVSAMRKELKNE